MLTIVVPIALGAIGLAMMLNLWRLVKGPDMVDRILALDTLTINGIALVMLVGIARDSSVYFEVALLLAMMGFVGTVGLCKFLLSGAVIDREP